MNKKFLAFIPARGGSKGIHKKNIALLAGRPLISYCIDATLASAIFDKIICSTDDQNIADVARQRGISVDIRSENLSGDLVNVHDVVRDYFSRQSFLHEYVALIQPTSPFILANHIQLLANRLNASQEYLTAQTIIKVPHHFHAWNQRMILDGNVEFVFKSLRDKAYNKQLKPDYFSLGNLLISKTSNIINGGTFFSSPSTYLEIDWPYNIDIDTKDDLILAEALIKFGAVKIDQV